jgi:hypothetical protein
MQAIPAATSHLLSILCFPWFRFMFYRLLRADLVSLPGATAGIDGLIVCWSLAYVQGAPRPSSPS